MVPSLVPIYFDSSQLVHAIKTNYIKLQTIDPGDILNFNFAEQRLGLVSPPHFVYDFSRKLLHMLRSIKWPNFIV